MFLWLHLESPVQQMFIFLWIFFFVLNDVETKCDFSDKTQHQQLFLSMKFTPDAWAIMILLNILAYIL